MIYLFLFLMDLNDNACCREDTRGTLSNGKGENKRYPDPPPHFYCHGLPEVSLARNAGTESRKSQAANVYNVGQHAVLNNTMVRCTVQNSWWERTSDCTMWLQVWKES
jgi:hypothetical protein